MDGTDEGAVAAEATPSQGQPMPMANQGPLPPTVAFAAGQGGMGSHMNTKAGKFLLAAVVLGLLAVTLSSAGYDESKYLSYKCTKYQQKKFELDEADRKKLEEQLKKYQGQFSGPEFEDDGPKYDPPTSCVDDMIMIWTYEFCTRYRDAYQKQVAYREKKGKPLTPEEKEMQPEPSCPEKWLAVSSVFIIGIAWAAILVIFIVLNVVPSKPLPQQLGLLGSAICAVLFLIAALLLLAYVISAFASNKPCTQAMFDKQDAKRKNDTEYRLAQRDPDDDRYNGYFGNDDRNPYVEREHDTCVEFKNDLYKVWFLLFGSIFAGVTTVFLGLTAFQSLRDRKRGPAVSPLMPGSGQPPTAYSQPQEIRPPGY